MRLKITLALLTVLQLFTKTHSAYYAINVNITSMPFISLLRGPSLFCSGAIISDRHIMTAAHCLPVNDTIEITVGSDLYEIDKNKNPHALVIESSKMWAHEKFSLPSAVYDIGVIELPKALKFSNAIRPINISTKKNIEDDPDDLEVVSGGFGYSENSFAQSENLLYSRMKFISLKECRKYKSHYIEDLNDNHICMTSIKGQTCNGDSGSAVVSVKTRNLVGIISYIKDAENGEDIGYSDCEALVPTVATRVSSYIDWISEKTGIDFKRQNLKSTINYKTFGKF